MTENKSNPAIFDALMKSGTKRSFVSVIPENDLIGFEQKKGEVMQIIIGVGLGVVDGNSSWPRGRRGNFDI